MKVEKWRKPFCANTYLKKVRISDRTNFRERNSLRGGDSHFIIRIHTSRRHRKCSTYAPNNTALKSEIHETKALQEEMD